MKIEISLLKMFTKFCSKRQQHLTPENFENFKKWWRKNDDSKEGKKLIKGKFRK